jgi:hypothetical protein
MSSLDMNRTSKSGMAPSLKLAPDKRDAQSQFDSNVCLRKKGGEEVDLKMVSSQYHVMNQEYVFNGLLKLMSNLRSILFLVNQL